MILRFEIKCKMRLFKRNVLIHLKGIVTEKVETPLHSHTHFPPPHAYIWSIYGLLPKWLHQPGLSHAEVRSKELHWCLSYGCKCPILRSIFHYLFRSISREQEQKWNSEDLIWDVSTAESDLTDYTTVLVLELSFKFFFL